MLVNHVLIEILETVKLLYVTLYVVSEGAIESGKNLEMNDISYQSNNDTPFLTGSINANNFII